MTALIVDTSRPVGFIAISRQSSVVECLEVPSKDITNLIPDFLDKIEHLDYIAAGIGPGSYTGIRSTVAFANALAYAKQCPLLGFYSPLAYLPKLDGPCAYLFEGKREDITLLTCQIQDGTLISSESPKAIPKDELTAHLPPSANITWAHEATLNLAPLARSLHARYLANPQSPPKPLTPCYLYEIPVPVTR